MAAVLDLFVAALLVHHTLHVPDYERATLLVLKVVVILNTFNVIIVCSIVVVADGSLSR